MSDEKREAILSYKKLLSYQEENLGSSDYEVETEICGRRDKIRVLILQFLCSCQVEDRFHYQEIPRIILNSPFVDYFPGKSQEAFYDVESYILLLCLMPWKQEFHKLKLIGFREVSEGLLKLEIVPPLEILQYIAFECLMAAVECSVIEEIWKRVKNTGIKYSEVVEIRFQNSGSVDSIATSIEAKFKSQKNLTAVNCPDSATSQSSYRTTHNSLTKRGGASVTDRGVFKSSSGKKTTDDFRNKLQKHMEVLGVTDPCDVEKIPFMDEETKEYDEKPVDIDEHVLASLQCLEDKEISPIERTDTSNQELKGSREWAFVTDSLHRRYGDKYFEGPRKDILTNKQDPSQMKSPYVKLQAVENPHLYANSPAAIHNRVQQLGDLSSPVIQSRDSDYISDLTQQSQSPSAYLTQAPTPREMQAFLGKDRPQVQPQSEIHLRQGHISQVPRQSHTEPIAKRSSAPLNYYTNQLPSPHSTPIMTPPVMVNQPNYIGHSPVLPPSSNNLSQSSGSKQPSNIQMLSKTAPNNSLTQARLTSPSQRETAVYPLVSGNQNVLSPQPLLKRSVTEPVYGRAAAGQLVKQQNAKLINTYPSQMSKNTWSCTACTYINDWSERVCAMCSKSRDIVDTDSPPEVGQSSRVCGQCTLENGLNAMKCHACGNELKGSQTVV
ncbi:hypothetical protein MAR_027552 [Mya arenaria]|uniref:RanBP2-type domain-containing protein n=1 Tax=Mya arenaria TaxID=6604 RepID=A0ABY7ETS5_MYAAR|nr:hypothetical protein MAR_027552 [Mya arenaria]